jgi:hypothetical protein
MTAQTRRPVHYELFTRKTKESGWVLGHASEKREEIIQEAQALISAESHAAVKVTKESFDPSTGEFLSVVLLMHGQAERSKAKSEHSEHSGQVCGAPQDLYTPLAREKISRLLKDWLRRYYATAFELLHRADLMEAFEASNTDLQHAIQKIAIADSSHGAKDLHSEIRRWQELVEKAVARVVKDEQKGLFFPLDPKSLPHSLEKLEKNPERQYVFGGCLALGLKNERRALAKLDRLLRLIPDPEQKQAFPDWAKAVLEAFVMELFATQGVFRDMLGEDSDLGDSLSILVRLILGDKIKAYESQFPDLQDSLPALKGALQDYSVLIQAQYFGALRPQMMRQLLSELSSPKRLRPRCNQGEVRLLRLVSKLIIGLGSDDHEKEIISQALSDRSKIVVMSDFVEGLLSVTKTSSEEIDQLMILCESVYGASAKRQAARWLLSSLGSVKYEREIRDQGQSVSQRLGHLSKMQWRVLEMGLSEADSEAVTQKIGHISEMIAQDTNLIPHMIKATPDRIKRLSVMLGFATGQSAPFGPISDQARLEVMKLIKNPDVRRELASQPAMIAVLRPLLLQTGLAA